MWPGLYYAHFSDYEIDRRDLRQIVAVALWWIIPGARCTVRPVTIIRSLGEGTYHLTEQFLNPCRPPVDARCDRFSSTISISTSLVDLPGIRINDGGKGSHDNDGVSGRVGAQFDFTKSVTAYATYSRGYKGPGLQQCVFQLPQCL